MSETFTKGMARNIYFGGSSFFFLIFLALTYHTEQTFPARSNEAQLTESVVRGKLVWEQNNCIGCHHMTDKKVGPTWKAIADKYKGQPDAEKVLTESIVKGAKDKFGKVPMPPQPKAKADAGKMAKWILTL